jgi:predicted aminopeptidase
MGGVYSPLENSEWGVYLNFPAWGVYTPQKAVRILHLETGVSTQKVPGHILLHEIVSGDLKLPTKISHSIGNSYSP